MLTLNTPAKINLSLNIQRPRSDGFHEVCFIMQTVALWDTLEISKTSEHRSIQLTSNHPELIQKPEENLIVRAYQSFFETAQLPPQGLNVHLEKRIPIQAGLGGGSSDAAAMLFALNQLTGNPISPIVLRKLGASLGSDVPFFFYGGTAMATGRGESIIPLPHLIPEFPVFLVKPKSLGIPTPLAYSLYRQANMYETVETASYVEKLNPDISLSELNKILFNDFEKVLFKAYPILQDISHKMKSLGVQRPLLCGSGPTMAGLMASETLTEKQLQLLFPSHEYDVILTHLLSKHAYPEGT